MKLLFIYLFIIIINIIIIIINLFSNYYYHDYYKLFDIQHFSFSFSFFLKK